MKKNTQKRNWTEEIANRFIDELENGTIPWVKPWDNWKSWSRNTGNDYQGVNQLMLSGGEFLTFNQIKEAGGHLEKGSKGEKVVFYKEYMRKDEDPETGEEVQTPAKVLKAYTVFKITDTDLEQKHDKKQPAHKWDAIDKAEEIATKYAEAYGVTIEHGGNRAFNSGGGGAVMGNMNRVQLPKKEQFSEPAEYYSTLFHELTHSTAGTIGRDTSKYASDKKERAREELVAEIGAAYILSYLGIESEFSKANSGAYARSWAENLKDDKAAIMYATPKAIAAANLILGIEQ